MEKKIKKLIKKYSNGDWIDNLITKESNGVYITN